MKLTVWYKYAFLIWCSTSWYWKGALKEHLILWIELSTSIWRHIQYRRLKDDPCHARIYVWLFAYHSNSVVEVFSLGFGLFSGFPLRYLIFLTLTSRRIATLSGGFLGSCLLSFFQCSLVWVMKRIVKHYSNKYFSPNQPIKRVRVIVIPIPSVFPSVPRGN